MGRRFSNDEDWLDPSVRHIRILTEEDLVNRERAYQSARGVWAAILELLRKEPAFRKML